LRGKIVLYDRYYFDFIADARRSNIQLPKSVTETGYHFLMKPEFNFFLYAAPEKILSRKKELSYHSICDLTSEYSSLFSKLERKNQRVKYLAIENNDLDVTLGTIMNTIITEMKKLVVKIIKLRSPYFTIDDDLNSGAVLQFIWIQLWSIIRGFRMLLSFRNPKGMLLGKRVSFFNVSKIKWGKFLRLGNDVYVSALAKHGIEFGDNVSIGAFSRVIVSTSFNNIGEKIKIGNNVGIGEFAYLGGSGGLEIGDECIVGQYLSCHPKIIIMKILKRQSGFRALTEKE
jgi:hypothetical protein